MVDYSLQSSFVVRTKKKAPTLDLSVSKRVAPVVLRTQISTGDYVSGTSYRRKGLDSLRRERRSFLIELQERSFSDSCLRLKRKIELHFRHFRRIIVRWIPTLTSHKMLYGSIVGGIAFGMVSMAFMEHYFGSGVFAFAEQSEVSLLNSSVTEIGPDINPTNIAQGYDPEQDVFFEYFGQVTKEKYEESVRDMVKGYPIEEMLPYIFEQDRLTAAFLVGIAKKESNWGKRIPVLDGQDCFNYWGYRGIRRMMGSGGHTCFNSSKDAVETVAKRLETLTNSEKLNTPEKMIVWKCGFSCQGHSRESVKKWISDVDMYFSQISDE